MSRAQQDAADSFAFYGVAITFALIIGWQAVLFGALVFVAGALVAYVATRRRASRFVDAVGHTTINGVRF